MSDKRFMPKVLFIAVLTWVSSAGAAWIPFEGTDRTQPELQMRMQSWETIAFDVALHGVDAVARDTKGGTHTILNFEGNAFSGEHGFPRLPVLRKFVEVPFGAEITLTIDSSEPQDLTLDLPLVPVQPPIPKLPGAAEAAPFIKNDDVYARDEWLGNALVTIRDDDIMRGHRIVVIEISPVSYNPAKNAIRVVSSMSIDLNLKNADRAVTLERAKRYASQPFNQVFDQMLINFGESKNFSFPPAAPIEYLVIAATDYQTALTPFIDWKEQCGYNVTMVTAPSGATTTTIYNLIHTAYIGSNPPDYVLLAGDTNTIPCYTGEESGTADDNQYTEQEGTGYWTPDVMIGRFPVRSVTDVENLLNKLLQFEQMTMPSKDYFKDSVWLAATDHATQLEATHEFCFNTYVDPVDAANNTPHWVYERLGGATADFASNVNAGRGIVCYSGHGYGDGTGTASIHFVDSNVQALTNVDKYGNVNIFACGTNKHDQTVSFGERWVLVANKGSISYWGTSNNSYWDEDDWEQREIYRCQYQDSVHTLSAAYFYGLIEVYEQSSATNSAYYFDIYNLMGDPSTDFVTRIPQTITITSANSATPNEQDFPVTVTVGGSARAGALVAITMNGSLLGAAYTNASGLASVHITPPAPGTALITVTGHNLIPQTKNLSIMAAGCGAAALDQTIYTCSDLITMRVWDSDLNTNPSTVNTATVTIASTTESTPETVTVTETGVNTGEFVGTIQGSASQSGAGYLRLTHGDTITLHYHDAACEGSSAEVYDTATADCQGPVITNVQITGITGFTATVTWTTSEPSVSRVRYGTSTPPGTVSEATAYVTTHSRTLTGLTACTQYFFQVEAEDAYGNATVDTNGGSYYNFTTAGSRVAMSADMSTNPGWTTTGQWAWGQPTGVSGDPTAGYTGNNVYGYNLAGAYGNSIAEYALTAPAVNCSTAYTVSLSFYRWLGVEDGSYDHARIQVSTNGSTWNTVWENGSDDSMQDTAWTQVTYDLTAWAAGQAAVQIRWTMGTTDGSVVYSGWNIDDVTVTVEEPCGTPTATPTGPTPTPTRTPTATPTATPTTGPGSCGSGYTQVTLLTEAFTTWPLTGWTVVNNVGTCGWRAGAGDNGTDDENFTGGSGEYADADSDDCGSGSTTNTELRTPVLNLSGLTNPWLTFQSDMRYYSSGGSEYWHVDVTTNGGTNWTTILNRSGGEYRGPEMIQLDLTAYQGQSAVMVRFHYYGQYDYWWQIDDVLVTACQVTGATATPTRTPTVAPNTPTPTRTPTNTPTPTRTPTNTPTNTPPPATATPTRTPTMAPNTPTPTRTPTSAPSTPTPTSTPTTVPNTPTPTATQTPVPVTPTPTNTPAPGTPTPTPTPQPVPSSGSTGLAIMILVVSALILLRHAKR